MRSKKLNALRTMLNDYEARSVFVMTMMTRKVTMMTVNREDEEKEYHSKSLQCKYLLCETFVHVVAYSLQRRIEICKHSQSKSIFKKQIFFIYSSFYNDIIEAVCIEHYWLNSVQHSSALLYCWHVNFFYINQISEHFVQGVLYLCVFSKFFQTELNFLF